MPLKNLVGLRQTDTGTLFFGCEIKLKNFILHILSNSQALISDFSNDGVFLAMRRDGKLSALRHRLNSVDHHIQKRLLHQVEVGLDDQGLREHDSPDFYVMLLRLRCSKQRNIVEQAP